MVKPIHKPEAEVRVETIDEEESFKVNPEFNPFKSIAEEKAPILPDPEEQKAADPVPPKTSGLQMVIEEKQEALLQPELLTR